MRGLKIVIYDFWMGVLSIEKNSFLFSLLEGTLINALFLQITLVSENIHHKILWWNFTKNFSNFTISNVLNSINAPHTELAISRQLSIWTTEPLDSPPLLPPWESPLFSKSLQSLVEFDLHQVVCDKIEGNFSRFDLLKNETKSRRAFHLAEGVLLLLVDPFLVVPTIRKYLLRF